MISSPTGEKGYLITLTQRFNRLKFTALLSLALYLDQHLLTWNFWLDQGFRCPASPWAFLQKSLHPWQAYYKNSQWRYSRQQFNLYRGMLEAALHFYKAKKSWHFSTSSSSPGTYGSFTGSPCSNWSFSFFPWSIWTWKTKSWALIRASFLATSTLLSPQSSLRSTWIPAPKLAMCATTFSHGADPNLTLSVPEYLGVPSDPVPDWSPWGLSLEFVKSDLISS